MKVGFASSSDDRHLIHLISIYEGMPENAMGDPIRNPSIGYVVRNGESWRIELYKECFSEQGPVTALMVAEIREQMKNMGFVTHNENESASIPYTFV